MPRTRASLIIFALAFFCAFQSKAQPFFKSIKARSISAEFTQHQASFRDSGFDQFRNSSRFGDLFDDAPNNYTWIGDLEDKSFNLLMNFKMKDSTLYRHEFLAGIKTINQKVNWLSGTDILYKGRSELMKATIGYRFYMVKLQRLRFSAGSNVDFGFTVSSFTEEYSGYDESEYFGQKGLQGGIEFPFTVEVSPIKGLYIYLGIAPGTGVFNQDGFSQLIFSKNVITGLRFDI